MSVDNFIPEMWAAELDTPFQKNLVYASPNIANTRFQAMLQNSGDSVNIPKIGAAAVKTHDRTVDLEYDDVSVTTSKLVMDQEDYYGFRVSDVDEVQAAGDFEGAATAQHGIAMSNKVDTYIAGILKEGAGKKLGNTPVFDGADFFRPAEGQSTAWDIIRRIAKELNKVSAPSLNRWAVVGADLADALVADRRVTEVDKAGTDAVARTGMITQIPLLGITVYASNNAPTVSTREVAIGGVHGALDFASQLRTMEAFRNPNRFGDIIRGLQVYGGVVSNPDGLVSVEVDVKPGTLGSAPAPAEPEV